MTKEEVNTAIAEHLGILFFHEQERLWHVKGSGFFSSKECAVWKLPNYHGDLNAMHEAELALTQGQQEEYDYQLSEITAPITAERWLLLHATAAQRAEAFLRVFNLWKD